MDRIKSYTEPPAAGRIYHTINQSTNSASIVRPFQPLCRFRAPLVISLTKEGIILSFLLPRGQLLYTTRNCQNDYPSPATLRRPRVSEDLHNWHAQIQTCSSPNGSCPCRPQGTISRSYLQDPLARNCW